MSQIPDYDAGFCGKIPLNRINHIQSYGCLIITDRLFNIVQVSENVLQFVGIAHQELIDTSVLKFLSDDNREKLERMLTIKRNNKFSLSLEASGHEDTSLLAIVSVADNYLIFEIEKSRNPEQLFTDAYQRIRNVTAVIETRNVVDEILDTSVKELKQLSGFDKVMIYQFDENWNGHVVAEAMEEGMDSYLGLYFPASDIPKQAREMYEKSPYRFIPDAGYEPVQLYPLINPQISGFIDLSTCNARGVAKVHVEYLQNMHVQSSMSTRIIKDNKLWGLISCHHRSPFFMNFDECLVFELVGNTISARLSATEIRDEVDRRQKMQSLQTTIIENIYSEKSLRRGITKSFNELMDMFDCNGAVFIQQNNFYGGGIYPERDALEDFVNWLQAKNIQKPFITSNLSREFVSAPQIAKDASGVIVLPIINENKEFLICFRGEVPQYINWGGNPNEAVQFEQDKITYHPRNSFKIWKQTLKNSSFPFTRAEVDMAQDTHRILLNYRLMELSKQI